MRRLCIISFTLCFLFCALSCSNLFFIKATGLYEVSFAVNGSTSIDSYRTNEIKDIPQTSRDGYVFAGWYTKSDLSGNPVTFPFEVTKEETLYAKWLETYNVTFVTNGGSQIASYKTAIISSKPSCSRTGYSLWVVYRQFFIKQGLLSSYAECRYCSLCKVAAGIYCIFCN